MPADRGPGGSIAGGWAGWHPRGMRQATFSLVAAGAVGAATSEIVFIPVGEHKIEMVWWVYSGCGGGISALSNRGPWLLNRWYESRSLRHAVLSPSLVTIRAGIVAAFPCVSTGAGLVRANRLEPGSVGS